MKSTEESMKGKTVFLSQLQQTYHEEIYLLVEAEGIKFL
jgi:hypothetical protein